MVGASTQVTVPAVRYCRPILSTATCIVNDCEVDKDIDDDDDDDDIIEASCGIQVTRHCNVPSDNTCA